jgi:DNA-binding response OmpR family regulator
MLSARDFRDVRIALIEGNPRLSNDLVRALEGKGINNPVVCKEPDDFLAVASHEPFDILLCDANTLGGDFPSEMQRIRRNEAGGNPFVVTIATVHDASADSVRTLLDSGIDDLLVKPTPVQHVMDRVDHMISNRRGFVVTTGYVGPSRRSARRTGDTGEATLNAPNTLHCKVIDKMDAAELGEILSQATNGLQEKMAQHPLLGIDRLIQRTQAYSRSGDGADELRRDFGYLTALGMEMSARYRGTPFANIADLATALSKLAQRIAGSSPAELRTLDFDPLSRLGEVLRRSLAAEERAIDKAALAAGASQAATAKKTESGLRFTPR